MKEDDYRGFQFKDIVELNKEDEYIQQYPISVCSDKEEFLFNAKSINDAKVILEKINLQFNYTKPKRGEYEEIIYRGLKICKGFVKYGNSYYKDKQYFIDRDIPLEDIVMVYKGDRLIFDAESIDGAKDKINELTNHLFPYY